MDKYYKQATVCCGNREIKLFVGTENMVYLYDRWIWGGFEINK